jgi:hypothetical protein
MYYVGQIDNLRIYVEPISEKVQCFKTEVFFKTLLKVLDKEV